MKNILFTRHTLFQIIFWAVAYLVLTSIVLLLLKSQQQSIHINVLINAGSAILIGIFQGITFGVTEQALEKELFRKQALGINIAFRALLYFLTTVVILSVFRNFVYDRILVAWFGEEKYATNERSWEYIFYLMIIYNFIMSLMVSFITQVNKKFGAGMMMPLILGKYRTPKEEHRIFLFMDLKSSTTIAEELGHILYSSFIRDCFLDINLIAYKHNGEIYQYVGDEVVITWRADDRTNDLRCMDFFFDCEAQFRKRSTHYQKNYGQDPQFKAGAHAGNVTAVEIGETKRDIAYHGDTLNTAARLQSMCNEYEQLFLISGTLASRVRNATYLLTSLGDIQLKGKVNTTEIVSVAKMR